MAEKLEINNNLIASLDCGVSSCGASSIDALKHSIYTQSSIWPSERTSETSEKAKMRRQIIRKNEMMCRLRRVLYIAGCLPDSYSKHFNFEATENDRGLGTLKRNLNKHMYIDIFDGKWEQLSLQMLEREIKSIIPDYNGKVSKTWLPVYLAKEGIHRMLSKEEFACVLLHLAHHRGSSFLDKQENDDDKKVSEFKKEKMTVEQLLDENNWTPSELEFSRLIENIKSGRPSKIGTDTVSRSYHKNELRRLFDTQKKFHSWLVDRTIYENVVSNLYPNNTAHRSACLSTKPFIDVVNNSEYDRDLSWFIIEDVIMFQRPLKSQKDKIRKCPLKKETYYDANENMVVKRPHVICKSHPVYAEYRIRLFINSLHFVDNNTDEEVSFDKKALFDKLWITDSVKYDEITSLVNLNNVTCKFTDGCNKEKSFKTNKYGYAMANALIVGGMSLEDAYSMTVLERLWHVMYSVSNEQEIIKALHKVSDEYSLDWDAFRLAALEMPDFKKDGYGEFSLGAIKRILPYIKDGNSLYAAKMKAFGDNISLPKRRAETIDDLNRFCEDDFKAGIYPENFRQAIKNNLKGFCDMVRHNRCWPNTVMLESTKELPNSQKKRKEIQKHQEEHAREKSLRMQILSIIGVELSSANILKLRILEEWVRANDTDAADAFKAYLKSKSDEKEDMLKKYVNVLDNKYRCPYCPDVTLSFRQVFNGDIVNREHILAYSNSLDNSFENLVLAPKEVNSVKGDMTGMEFIQAYGGTIIDGYRIAAEKEYTKHVKDTYKKSLKKKCEKLLSTDAQMSFNDFQLIATQITISYLRMLISSVYYTGKETGEYASNVQCVSSKVVSSLKDVLGINKIWHDKIALPRMKRLDEKNRDWNSSHSADEQRKLYVKVDKDNKEYVSPSDGFEIKRLDHRNHAMDAFALCLCTGNVLNIYNRTSRFDKNVRSVRELIRNMVKDDLWETVVEDGMKSVLNSETEHIRPVVKGHRSRRGVYKKYDNGKKKSFKTKSSYVPGYVLHKATKFSKKDDGFYLKKSVIDIFDSKKEISSDREILRTKFDVIMKDVRCDRPTRKILEYVFFENKGRMTEDVIASMNTHIDEICDAIGIKHHMEIRRLMYRGSDLDSVKFEIGSGSKAYVEKEKGSYVAADVYAKDERRFVAVYENSGEIANKDELAKRLKKGFKKIAHVKLGDLIEVSPMEKYKISSISIQQKIYGVPSNWSTVVGNELDSSKSAKKAAYRYNDIPLISCL